MLEPCRTADDCWGYMSSYSCEGLGTRGAKVCTCGDRDWFGYQSDCATPTMAAYFVQAYLSVVVAVLCRSVVLVVRSLREDDASHKGVLHWLWDSRRLNRLVMLPGCIMCVASLLLQIAIPVLPNRGSRELTTAVTMLNGLGCHLVDIGVALVALHWHEMAIVGGSLKIRPCLSLRAVYALFTAALLTAVTWSGLAWLSADWASLVGLMSRTCSVFAMCKAGSRLGGIAVQLSAWPVDEMAAQQSLKKVAHHLTHCRSYARVGWVLLGASIIDTLNASPRAHEHVLHCVIVASYVVQVEMSVGYEGVRRLWREWLNHWCAYGPFYDPVVADEAETLYSHQYLPGDSIMGRPQKTYSHTRLSMMGRKPETSSRGRVKDTSCSQSQKAENERCLSV